MLIIPAIDLKDGQCVRLQKGDFARTTVFSDNPLATAKKWFDAGARRLHLVDLDGAVSGTPAHLEIVREIVRELPELPVQVGGGIRSFASANAYIEAGVRYLIIGTKAIIEPPFVAELCRRFPGRIIVGLDAKNGKVATEGWQHQSDQSAIGVAHGFANLGVAAIVYTDIDKDGMMSGVNIRETVALAKSVDIPIIASGGITTISDIAALVKEKKYISAAITGRAIYAGTLDFSAAQRLADEN